MLISDCIISELDLGSATAARVALKNCTIGSLDLAGAKLKDFDLRGTDFRSISGLESLAGVVIDEYQLGLLAPLLAAHLGVVVADAPRLRLQVCRIVTTSGHFKSRQVDKNSVPLTGCPHRVIFIERTVGNYIRYPAQLLRKDVLMVEAFLVGGARTPVGRYGGALSAVRPDDLAALVVREAVARAGVDPDASTRSSSATPTAPARRTGTWPAWPPSSPAFPCTSRASP